MLVSHGGEGGIRTHGTLARTLVFKTSPLNHSGTSPAAQNIPIFSEDGRYLVRVFFGVGRDSRIRREGFFNKVMSSI